MQIVAKRWKGEGAPKRILVIRLQAMGDVVITLPYVRHLRNILPQDTIIDFLTREESADIPRNIRLFNAVFAIAGGRSFRKQACYTLLLLPRLLLRRYDVVLDLQNNSLSRLVRKAIAPRAWTEFDRYSPASAGERNRRTIAAAGLSADAEASSFQMLIRDRALQLLHSNGWRGNNPIVVLNPAGAFENRNWALANYIRFAELWKQEFPDAQFLIMGVDKVAGKAEILKRSFGKDLINLVNQTKPSEAFAILQQAQFVLSEDSGLMHMAWVSGIPTLAMFGSSRSDWSRPLGEHTDFLDSSDMTCGACMSEICRHSGALQNHCMTRLSAEVVFARAVKLLQKHVHDPVVET